MENLRRKILKDILKNENIEIALNDLKKFIDSMGVNFLYYFIDYGNNKEYSTDKELKKIIFNSKKYTEMTKKEDENGLNLIYKSLSMGVVFHINYKLKDISKEEILEIEEEIELVLELLKKVIEFKKIRIYSLITPLFFEVSKILYSAEGTIKESLEELNLTIEGLLGIEIVNIEKNNIEYFIKEEKEKLFEYKYKDMIVKYKKTRKLDNLIEIDKILNLIFMILNSFLKLKELEKKKQIFLEEQINTKENLEKLNEILEKSLYKMTFINKLYSKLSKTRNLEESIRIIEKLIRDEVDYRYLRIKLGDTHLVEDGIQVEEAGNVNYSSKILKGKIEYEIICQKEDITSEDEVYLNLIFTHSKIELENILLYKKVEELATIDGVTELYIHRYFIERLKQELEINKRNGSKVSLIMLDIDNFKKYNDTYGHQAGDEVLHKVASLMKRGVRKIDIPCRYGGEEFIVILPYTDIEKAEFVAERIRQSLEEETDITASFGVTEYLSMEKLETFVKRVDDAMYKAKQNGKNQVIRM
ncbi:GGDEF domain-containing protein [Haliovirga abyssi]|uniref:GGDEF domain-containing protein n=1 Tax=Haliovirga abyssi TaxID=2996794 RepID=A0AAU9DS67_9FUSO|nr:GGDEF domain-containing protein [Haliovirga abyssi]BDU49839.1 hypothetical protein HLVA_04080 [Haliovirga abyssi]